jgi:hypothetical protein
MGYTPPPGRFRRVSCDVEGQGGGVWVYAASMSVFGLLRGVGGGVWANAASVWFWALFVGSDLAWDTEGVGVYSPSVWVSIEPLFAPPRVPAPPQLGLALVGRLWACRWVMTWPQGWAFGSAGAS